MNIKTLATGQLEANTYIVWEDGSKEAIVIDPGGDADRIEAALEREGLAASYVLLTHGHCDHIGAVDELKEKYGAKVAIHEADAEMLTAPSKNLSAFVGGALAVQPADVLLRGGDEIEAAGLVFVVLHTPGHSKGSACFMTEDVIFTGDTLFQCSIGRTDFPGGSMSEIDHSVKKVLGGLDGDYKLYPGHGPATTLDSERQYNMFMRG
ncbi:MAG: MBL fold metallo-hydrolase [Christensenellaceae bacterium]|jgi:hydroxyacylglutathione hydrolase